MEGEAERYFVRRIKRSTQAPRRVRGSVPKTVCSHRKWVGQFGLLRLRDLIVGAKKGKSRKKQIMGPFETQNLEQH